MKKKRTWIIIALLAVVLFLGWRYLAKSRGALDPANTGEVVNDVPKPTSGGTIAFTGKVLPAKSQLVYKDNTKVIETLHVEENQQVAADELLITYYGQNTVNLKIVELQNQYIFLQENIDWYYTRIAEIDQELSWTTDAGYIQALNKEKATLNTQIAETRINWIDTNDNIKKLKDSLDDYEVLADFDGFVYEITENGLATSAYLTLYSNSRIVRFEVGEYELKYIELGKEVTVEIEGLGQTYTGSITYIDQFPNNPDENGTSYFNVEVALPDNLPIGYSAIVRIEAK
ncbi:MAG: efflux RND transporter periplasmic adaptor subunit [Erysipelotrichaceae bacterium]|jgi:multidrug efflux pump subunit AcrA (membrane-fusion protein)|nr:efflux RND transporter periplasmic adaptor subunit [Erysipelotrichaceae bacterium]